MKVDQHDVTYLHRERFCNIAKIWQRYNYKNVKVF